MDICFSQVLQSGDVIVYVGIPFRGACFDGVVDVYAFNAGELRPASSISFLREGENVLEGQGFSGNGVVKGGDHAGYAWGIWRICFKVTVSNLLPYHLNVICMGEPRFLLYGGGWGVAGALRAVPVWEPFPPGCPSCAVLSAADFSVGIYLSV